MIVVGRSADTNPMGRAIERRSTAATLRPQHTKGPGSKVTGDVPLLVLLVVLVCTAVYLGAAEAAMIRVRPTAVEVLAEGGDRRAVRLLRLLEDLPGVMNTVLLAVLLVQIGAATVTGLLAQRHFGKVGITLASVALTLLLFVYAEAIPKTFALRNPTYVAKATTPLLVVLTRVLHPVVSLLVRFADFQAPGRGIAGTPSVSEAELLRLAAQAAEVGELAGSDLELMERALSLGDVRVDEIFVPRVDVVSVPKSASARHALDTAIESGHRRLAIYDDRPDNITSIVRLRDLARSVADGVDQEAGSLTRPVLVVPESKRVIELLHEMQSTGCHFAVAIDEHGSTAGIVTIEDVVEELVGDVADEGEETAPAIEEISSGRWRVDARTAVARLETALGLKLPQGEWRTVGGLVIGLAGRIVRVGETLTIEGIQIRVTRATGRRVREIEIDRV
jgi:CBS domain containing-hemolysin-like protein